MPDWWRQPSTVPLKEWQRSVGSVVGPLERETKDSISLVSGNGLAAPNSEHLAVAEDQS